MSEDAAEEKRARRAAQLQMVLAEIKDSEEQYIIDLEHVIYTYINPLRKERSGLISEEEMSNIFSNLEELVGVSQQLLARLEENHTIYNVARSFKSMTERLKLFSSYTNTQDDALALVEKLQHKNKKWKEFLEENQAKEASRNLGLRDFLIKPTQRICKYPLFMRELLSACDDERAKVILEDVDKRVNGVVLHINEQKKRKEGMEGTQEVADQLIVKFPGNLVTQTRWLLYKGERELILLEKTNTLSTGMATLKSSSGTSSPKLVSRSRSRKNSDAGKKRRTSAGGRRRSSDSIGRKSGGIMSMSLGSGSGAGLKAVRLYLFNDLIMCCSLQRKGLGIEFYTEIDTFRVEEVSEREFRVRLLIDEGGQFETIYLFGCEDKFEKDAWLNQFRALPNNVMAVSPFIDPEVMGAIDADNIEREVRKLEEQLKNVDIFNIKASLDINNMRKSKKAHYESVLFSVPQWLYRAQEATSVLGQIEGRVRSLETFLPSSAIDDDSSEEIVFKSDEEDSHWTIETYRSLLSEVQEKAKTAKTLCDAYQDLEQELLEMLKNKQMFDDGIKL